MDSAFAKPYIFRKLNSKSNLAHIRHTYNLSPETEDEAICEVARKENRIVITQDYDFKRFVSKYKIGVLIIPSYLSSEEMDNKLTDFISGKNPNDFLGKAIKVK